MGGYRRPQHFLGLSPSQAVSVVLEVEPFRRVRTGAGEVPLGVLRDSQRGVAVNEPELERLCRGDRSWRDSLPICATSSQASVDDVPGCSSASSCGLELDRCIAS